MENKNQEIETLRAFAILFAVAAHFNGFLFYNGIDWMIEMDRYFFFGGGVDLFFCVSGFVVSKSLIDYLDRHKSEGRQMLAIRAFWVRRIFRLLPSSWFWVMFGVISSTQFNKVFFSTTEANLKSALAVATFSGNILHPLNGILGPNVAYWSLALEEQFYFIFPFFLLLTSPKWRWKLLAAFTAVLFFIERPGGGLLWFTRVDGVMWGILIYLFTKTRYYQILNPKFMRSKILSFIVVTALLALIAGIPKMSDIKATLGINIEYGLIAICTAGLVFLASFGAGYINSKPNAVLAWLGSRSYAIYLLHIPAYRITNEIWQYEARLGTFGYLDYQIVWLLTSAALIVIFAELNFRLIETPLRLLGAKISKNMLNRPTLTVQN